MDRWLLKQRQQHSEIIQGQSFPNGKGVDGTNGSGEFGDTPMTDGVEGAVGGPGSSSRGACFTAINQLWRRNSHNAALSNHPMMDEWHLSHPGLATLQCPGDRHSNSRDHEERVIDEDAEETLGLAIDYKTCQVTLSEGTRLLVGERFLQVATHCTSGEIPEPVRLDHPEGTLPARLTTGIRQTLADSVTRVASQRGVAREAFKQELDSARAANRLLERQSAATAAKAKETRALKAVVGREKAVGLRTKTDPMEIDDDDEDGPGDPPAATATTGPGAGQKPLRSTPYGLGKPWMVQESERVIPDSE